MTKNHGTRKMFMTSIALMLFGSLSLTACVGAEPSESDLVLREHAMKGELNEQGRDVRD